MPIEPTNAEMIFWIVGGILSVIGLIALYIAGKRNTGYLKWVEDLQGWR